MIISLGIDIVDIRRFERATDRHGRRLLERLFTPHEQTEGSSRARPASSLAARFAAKEAAMKALGTGWTGGVGWHQIEIRGSTPPSLVLHGQAQRVAGRLGVTHTHVSLSHEETHAVAVVIFEAPPL